MTHELKTVQPYFEKIWGAEKTFEVRENDRDFQSGDVVRLKEYDPETDTYSGREVRVRISYVLSNYEAIKTGYVVFGFHISDWIVPHKNTKK